jgi:hypothetical protein
MGKSYKGGYLHVSDRFNRHIKKSLRKSTRSDIKYDCHSEVRSWNDDCNGKNSNLTKNTAKLSSNVRITDLSHPYKIGYCLNTHVTLDEIVHYTYAGCSVGRSDTHKGIPEQFKTSNNEEQLDMLLEELNTLWDKEYTSDINKLKKQLKRRGTFGYFRGHNKDLKLN